MSGNESYSGALIAESIEDGVVLEGVPFAATRIYRVSAGDIDVGQPDIWTFIEFTIDARQVDALIDLLRNSLRRAGGWYCDFHSTSEVIVVFRNRVFRYEPGDRNGRADTEGVRPSCRCP